MLISFSEKMEPEGNQIDEEKEDVDFAQPIFKKNIYQNPDSFKEWLNPPTICSFSGLRILFRWIFCEKNESKIPRDELQLQKTLPVQKPDFPITSPLGATWLGHATVFARVEGLSLITDPVWSAYASPLSWHGCRRYRPPPCEIAELPEIHIAVISHNHYDHLDHKAVKELNTRFPQMQWFVPRGLRQWMIQTIGEESTIHELSWGEHVELNLPNGGGPYKIWSVPAQHWSQRGLFDRFQSLWSGWIVEGPTYKFLFTGDTGFCENEFKKIGQKFGKIDLSAIPIGCYSPRWFMRPQHIDPGEAVQIHKLTNSRKSIAIHWGTYEMGSCEPYMEPASKLREEVEANGLNADEFTTLAHGESWTIDD